MRAPRLAAWGMAAVVAVGATCQAPPPDPDGLVGGAVGLELGRSYEGRVECSAGSGLSCSPPVRDCQDWYALRIPEEGRVDATLVPMAGGSGPPARLRLVLADATGTTLRSVTSEGTATARIRDTVLGRAYHVAVIADEPDRASAYRLRVRYSPKPAPPAPKFRSLRSPVLEVEAEGPGGGVAAVLIEAGSTAGVVRGVQGSLLDGGERIGEVVVETVYPDGSRARVTSLSRSPGPHSTVELRIPIGGESAP